MVLVLGTNMAAASDTGTVVIVVMVMVFRLFVALFMDEEEKT